MGNQPTQLNEQYILNYSTDFEVTPPLLQFGQKIWNGTGWIRGGGFGLPAYDYVSLAVSPATTETYTFKTGGASGETVATVVITYTDSTRATISTVARS